MDVVGIAIDADSLVFKACYRCQTPDGRDVNIEAAYLEFCYEIGKIKSSIYKLMKISKQTPVKPLIVLSPKKSFRNEIFPDYKANRKTIAIAGIKQLKLLIMHRLPFAAMAQKGIEADDMCIYYAKHKDYLVAAIDKDVINASPTFCYNYNKREWTQPHSDFEVEEWYVKQSLMGDTADNIPGAPGIGEEKAQQFVDKYFGDLFDWNEFSSLFRSEEDALLSMNLVRMDTIVIENNKFKHKPWSPWESKYWSI